MTAGITRKAGALVGFTVLVVSAVTLQVRTGPDSRASGSKEVIESHTAGSNPAEAFEQPMATQTEGPESASEARSKVAEALAQAEFRLEDYECVLGLREVHPDISSVHYYMPAERESLTGEIDNRTRACKAISAEPDTPDSYERRFRDCAKAQSDQVDELIRLLSSPSLVEGEPQFSTDGKETPTVLLSVSTAKGESK